MPSRLTLIAGTAFVAYLALVAAGTIALARVLGIGGDGLYFNVQRWETENVLGHFLYELRTAVTDEDEDSADALLVRYLDLNRQISELSSDLDMLPAAELEATERDLEAALDERSDIENRVEQVLERRVAAAIKSLELNEALPLFTEYAPVWPPVSAELGEPPGVLAVSPRDRIDLVDSDLLKPDLSRAEIVGIEARREDEQFAALVEDTGGVGTYPSNVRHRTSYEDALETIAHEWAHQYLAFYPLGFNYFDSNELRTLNETVANVIGEEVGRQAASLYPIDSEEVSSPEPSIDFRATMRALRLEVDDLLANGEIERAEERMEEVRRELAEGGINIRKINQAYFAFHGNYGDAPQSSSPIGPKVADLRGTASSLREFLQLIRDVTSEDELDALLQAAD
jgi:hypothetical protein